MSVAYSNYFPTSLQSSATSSAEFNFSSLPHGHSHLSDSLNAPSPAGSQEDSSENSNSPHAHSGEDVGKEGGTKEGKKIGRQKSAMTNAERRATHNAIERARRESLNGRFLQLAEALPSMSNVKRPSKSIIVNKSLEYITESIVREQMLIKENFELRREVDELRSRLGMPPLPPSQLSLQLSAAAAAAQVQQKDGKKVGNINPANVPLPQTPTIDFQPSLNPPPAANAGSNVSSNPSILAATALTSQWKSSASPSTTNHVPHSQSLGGLNFGFPTMGVETQLGNNAQNPSNPGSYFGLSGVSSPSVPSVSGYPSFGMHPQPFDFSMAASMGSHPHAHHHQMSVQVPVTYGGFPMMMSSPTAMGGYFPTSASGSTMSPVQVPVVPRVPFGETEEMKREESGGMEDDLDGKEDDSDRESRGSRGSSVGKDKVVDPTVHPLTSALGIEIFSPVRISAGLNNKKPSSASSATSSISANDDSVSNLSSSLGSLNEGKALGWFSSAAPTSHGVTSQQEPFSLFSSF